MRARQVGPSYQHGNNFYQGHGPNNQAGYGNYNGEKSAYDGNRRYAVNGTNNNYGNTRAPHYPHQQNTTVPQSWNQQYQPPVQMVPANAVVVQQQQSNGYGNGYYNGSMAPQQQQYQQGQQQGYPAPQPPMGQVQNPGYTSQAQGTYYATPPQNQYPHVIPVPQQVHRQAHPYPPHPIIQPVQQYASPVAYQTMQPVPNVQYTNQQPVNPNPAQLPNTQNLQQPPETPAVNDSKPPLFVNPALVASSGGLQVYSNADGYSEYYAPEPQNGHLIPLGFHSEQVGDASENGKQDRADNSEKPVVTEEQKQLTPSGGSQQPSDTFDSLSTMSSPSLEEDRSLSSNISVQNSQDRLLDSYRFDGKNFPMITDENSSETMEDYQKLLGDVDKLVKNFYRAHPNVVEQDISEEVQTENNVDQLNVQPENRVVSVIAEDNHKMVEIEFFVPEKPLFVPRQDILEFDREISLCSPRAIVNQPGTFEKSIPNPAETITLGEDSVSIKLNSYEHDQMEGVMRMNSRVTVIMHTDFPGDGNGTRGDSDSDTRPASPDDSGEGSSNPGPSNPSGSSNNASSSSGNNNRQTRSSRRSDYSSQGETSRRSTSNYAYMNSNLRWNAPVSQEPSTSEPRSLFNYSDRQPGPSHRRLPEIPPQYRNGGYPTSSQGPSGSEYGQCSSSQAGCSTQQQPTPSYYRRRHQSHDSAIRNDSGHQNWRGQEQLRFIIPTQREFMARIPFAPFRIPLIGVARRAPGNNYVPQRILPSHETFTAFRRRMQEMRMNDDVGDPENVRGSGPLMLEPRGYWYPTDEEMEELERSYQIEMSLQQSHPPSQQTNEPGPSNFNIQLHQEGVSPSDEELRSQFKSQLLSEKENERKKREAAQSCQSESSIRKYTSDSEDDEDDENSGGYAHSGASSFYSKHHPPSGSTPCSSSSGSSNKSPSSNSKRNERQVKDTAHKNQKRREKEIKRAQRKEEERLRLEALILKKEKKTAKLNAAEERKAQQEQQLALKQAELKQKLKEKEEQRARQEEERKAEKKKLMNQLNKEKKKKAKQNKFEAMKIAEEEKKRQLENPEQDTDNDVLTKLLKAKYLLIEDRRERIQKKMRPLLSKEDEMELREKMEPILKELCDYESLDMRSIRHRSDKVDVYFDLDFAFHKDCRHQLSLPEEGRFKMTEGICSIRELEHMMLYNQTHELKHARAVRQYKYWKENMYSELSLFINYTVGLDSPGPLDPTIELFEDWSIFNTDSPETMETVL